MIRYRLEAIVQLASPLHIGGLDRLTVAGLHDETQVKEIARDSKGVRTIPGSSIRGALRAFLRKAGQLDDVVWGSTEAASLITVDDVSVPVSVPSSSVDGNGVDRVTGAAAPRYLFRQEVIPAGTSLTLTFSARSTEEMAEAVHNQVGLMARALKDPTFSLGARGRVGWGRVKGGTSTVLRVGRWDTTSLKSLANYVEHRSDWVHGQFHPKDPSADSWWTDIGLLTPGPSSQRPSVRWTIGWKPRAGLMVQDHDENGNVVSSRVIDGRHVLPGSAIKGALRARASRIVRTALAAQGDLLPKWDALSLTDQLESDHVLVRELFGSTERAGRLTVADCYAAGASTTARSHNSLDRWSGGTRESHLWETQAAVDNRWDPIVLDVDLAELAVGAQRACYVLLGLVIAEICSGRLALGGHGTRGLGLLNVAEVKVSGSELGIANFTLNAISGQFPAEHLIKKLRHVWEVDAVGTSTVSWLDVLQEQEVEP